MSRASELTQVLNEIDAIIMQGIQERAFPGATLWIGWQGETIKCSAYGQTADKVYSTYYPTPVTTRTIYDLASLTKVVAPTCATMLLVEQGLLKLEDPIAQYIPQFATDQLKAAITIKHILTHTSGLPGPLKLHEQYHGEDQIIEGICHQDLVFAPGTQYLYNDLGFMLLGKAIQVASTLRLDEYTRKYIFEPLKMQDTMFVPPATLRERIAPTEEKEWRGGLIHGSVHDENAWAMGGIAGHAGLFSTVEDLARFCSMLLEYGKYATGRLLKSCSVAAMESIQVAGQDESYGLGWVINAPYFMGALASSTTFGHTGFTGTSMLLNSTHQLAIVFLTNRVCPTRNGPNLNPYRGSIADVVAKLLR